MNPLEADPLLVAACVGVLGTVVGGPVAARALQYVPERLHRRIVWLLILSALTLALAAEFLLASSIGGVFVYVLAALPGFITYLAFRSFVGSALVSLLPMYFVIGHLTRGRETFWPEIALDRLIPLQPEWVLVYGSLYVFVVPLPLIVVRDLALLRRAMQAFLAVMLTGYLGFLLFPTTAPRPETVPPVGFAEWALGVVYDIDPPHGCFPSLHVAYSFVSALTCYRVHRGVGAIAALWAALISVSTVFTKQHYVIDVIAGALMAFAAYAVFIRRYPFAAVPQRDRERAPIRALAVVGLFAAMVLGFWVAYATI